MSTVFQEFQKQCEAYADRPFLHIPFEAAKYYSDSAIDLGYGQALNAVNARIGEYKSKGYGLGHRVALLLENRQEFLIHWLALNNLGCSVVPINGEMQPDEIAYLLSHSESQLVISVPEKIPLLDVVNRTLEKSLPAVDCNAMDSVPETNFSASSGDPDHRTECALLYTSGSTGKPKGCILSNEYYTELGAWYRDLGGLCQLEPGKERLITPLPLVHMNAMATSTMGMIMTGGCIVQMDRFHPKTWWQSVRESQATALHYLGVMPAILLNMPEGDDDFSKQIKFGFGAGVNPKHHAPFEARFGFPLVEGWAMTECGAGGVIMASKEPRRVGTSCFGKPTDKVEYRLVDENKKDVPVGEPGELLVRAKGDNPFKGYFSGYLKDPKATEDALKDGWLHTGDVVREDEEGLLYFVDRRKNVIRRSGENISVLEVEAAMAEDPVINQVLITAVPDELRGDEVMACIIPKQGVTEDLDCAEEIVRRALQRLAYYKVPGFVAFCNELPVTASQKPRRGDVKRLAAERLHSGNCFDIRHLKKRAKP